MTADLSAYEPPPVSTTVDKPLDVRALLASEWARDRLATIGATTDRALQAELGPSEIGQACPRRLAYRIARTPIINMPDPLKAMFGTGLHAVIADGLRRMGPPGRYLIEHPVNYRGIGGVLDLHDRLPKRATDWKTTTKQRIAKYRADGPPPNYVAQVNIYAAGLMAQGEQVDTVALTFIPRDGELADIWTWTSVPRQEVADAAIARYDAIARMEAEAGGPAGVAAEPSNLCPWCPNYRPTATDLAVACPGKDTP